MGTEIKECTAQCTLYTVQFATLWGPQDAVSPPPPPAPPVAAAKAGRNNLSK